MASASGHGQASLITSFFKSPPKEAEEIEASQLIVKTSENQTTTDPVLQPSSTADWDFEHDGSDSDSSLDFGGDDCRERKPLVVSLCDLLSPEVMAACRPRQRLNLRKRKEQLRKENQCLFTDYVQAPPTGSQTAPTPPSVVAGDTREAYSHNTGNGVGQGTLSSLDGPIDSTNTQVGIGADPPSTIRDANLLSTPQEDQCSMEVPSAELLGSESVATKPEDMAISGGTPMAASSGSLKQSTLVRSSNSGLLHVVKAPPDPSEQEDKQHQQEDKQQQQENKQQHQQEDKQQQQQQQETQCEEGNVTEQIRCCSPDQSEPQNDSFEDFQMSRTGRAKKLLQNRKKSNGEEKMEDEAPDVEEVLPRTEPAVKRPRRAAATEARKKSLQLPRRRSRRHRSGFPSEVAEEKGSSSPSQHCDTTSEVTVISEASDTEVENGVVIVSPRLPTTSLVKHHSLPAAFEAGGVAGPAPPPSSSAILSTEWAKIFKQPTREACKGITEVIEVSSGVTEDEGSMNVSPKPQKTKSRKRSLSCSPLRRYRSRSSSPRFGSRPGSRSPLRHPSPLRISSPRRTAVVRQSPLKASLSSARQLPFTPRESRRTDSVDGAPYEGLVHVRQEEDDNLFWKLPAPPSVPVQRGWGGDCQGVGVRMTGSPEGISHGSLSLCDLNELSASCTQGETTPSDHGFVGSDEKLLSQLQEAYPEEKVSAIFDRYRRILQDKREGETQSEENRSLGIPRNSRSRSKDGKRSRRETAARRRKVNGAAQAMKVSIRTCACSEEGEEKGIQVDSSAYKRQSRRLSRNRNRTTSKATHKDLHEDRSGKPNHSSTSTPSCSPAFQSELWTEIYRPQKSSEVIGNRAHVEQLLAWLEAWKKAKGPTQSPDHVGQTTGSSARQKTGSCSNGSKKSTTDPTPSEKADKALLTPSGISTWANDTEDSDFISIAHLKRKRGATRCSNSSDSDNGDNEGEGLPCPVTLLCGDHGCGKTAAVYACAQELGYKVFEVNSTTIRSRQNVLNTLREATLSHQVATRPRSVPGGIAGFFRQTDVERKGAVKQEKQVKPPPVSAGSLYSFFKPTTEVKEKKNVRKKIVKAKTKSSPSEEVTKHEGRAKRKRRRKSSTVVVDSSSDEDKPQATPTAARRADSIGTSAVTLANATVILLEEVDVLFEEERGFWPAVYDIIETSKRPIVMTCSDHRYELYCDHEKLAFTQPSPRELSLHMQLLCLSHGCHLTAETANQIAVFLNRDIRSVFNCLQFWLSSPRQAPDPSTPPAVNNSQEVSNLAKRPQTLSFPLQLDHLLGLSSGHRPTADVVETLHRAGLEINYPIASVVPRVEGDPTARTSLSCGAITGKGSHLATPWRCTAVKKRLSRRYPDLDAMSKLCDDFSYMDAIASGSCDRHMVTQTPDPAPWWNCRPQTALSEEPATAGPCGASARGCRSVVATMEALVRERVPSSATVCGRSADIHGLMEHLERRRRLKVLHTAYLRCSEVFGTSWEASHSAMSVDCLPALKIICASENARQEANTKRRFRHYLQASVVDSSLLKSFPRTTSFF